MSSWGPLRHNTATILRLLYSGQWGQTPPSPHSTGRGSISDRCLELGPMLPSIDYAAVCFLFPVWLFVREGRFLDR